MSDSFVKFSESCRPGQVRVHTVKFMRAPLSTEEMDAYLKQLERMYEKKTQFYCIYDTTLINETVSWSYIMQQAHFMKAHKELTQKYMKMAVIICTSSLVTLTINAIFMMIPPSTEVEVVRTRSMALRYIQIHKRRHRQST